LIFDTVGVIIYSARERGKGSIIVIDLVTMFICLYRYRKGKEGLT